MKKLFAKIRKIKMTRWSNLSFGEKIVKVIMKLLKLAIIAAIIVTVAGVIFSVVMGFVIASAIVSAISGGLEDASHAYRPGDRYVHIRRY